MKKIKQQEFERLVREIIEEGRSIESVVKELQTENRTFNNKIQELSMTNPELYREFIAVHPYKPKERKDINIRGFIIEALKSDYTIAEMCYRYGISYRTITRRITQLKKSDNQADVDLYNIYKSVAKKRSTSRKPTLEETRIIDSLDREEVKGISDIERKRKELLELERQYQDLSLQFGKEEAAKRLGYTQNRIYKLLNELYRIEIESNETKRAVKPEQSFRNEIKVDENELVQNNKRKSSKNNSEKQDVFRDEG